MPTPLLVDSGFLYTLLDEGDRYHQVVKAVRAMETGTAVVPDVVLVEVSYLALRSDGPSAVVALLTAFERLNVRLEPITLVDVTRARDIMQTYFGARFDFVDCCLMALSERLTIHCVCTIDPSDFRIFKPRHCDYLDLLPPQLH